ncbi:hypothetical protein ACIQB5_51080 [Streptomyces sp. NPDC088560]|uniref:hypothetical protein n=1 Tax=Streptomyces sp. NPDC088560 TaxID=3365868 RepID=UPI00382AE574
MYVLVPDDPVFFAKFQSLEEPLLRHLYRLYCTGLEPDEERLVADAYDSWVQVLLKLPLWSQWHGTDASSDQGPDERTRYTLYSSRGQQLTSLYPIEVTAVDLGHLMACLYQFAEADRARGAVPRQVYAESCGDPPAREESLTDVFRRVMDVLLLPPPRGLLGALRHVTTRVPAVSVTLRPEQEAEYRRYCQEIVVILSSGDTFAYQCHRAMYL